VNLEQYQNLTGMEVSETDAPRVKAQIKRAISTLEGMLGYTLDPEQTQKNIYNEVGKAKSDFLSWPNVETSKLLPPDDVVGAYRLYRYNPNDRYLAVDPFVNIHAVKLVYIRTGYDDESHITFKTFAPDEVRAQITRDGFGKYIEKVSHYICSVHDIQHVQLAVDADWMFEECAPDEILWIAVDMVQAKLDPRNNIKAESIEGHSYSKFEKVAPELEPENIATLKKYAGPYGSINRTFPV
jgi:hypothetical protein